MIVLIILWVTLYLLWLWLYVKSLRPSSQLPSAAFFIMEIITLVVLTAEAVLYYLLRKKEMRRFWVRMHIGLLFFALFGTNLLYAAWIFSVTYGGTSGDFRPYISKALNIKMGLYYASLIIAHVFFIMTLIKGFSRKPLQEDIPEGEPGLLDDFRTVK